MPIDRRLRSVTDAIEIGALSGLAGLVAASTLARWEAATTVPVAVAFALLVELFGRKPVNRAGAVAGAVVVGLLVGALSVFVALLLPNTAIVLGVYALVSAAMLLLPLFATGTAVRYRVVAGLYVVTLAVVLWVLVGVGIRMEDPMRPTILRLGFSSGFSAALASLIVLRSAAGRGPGSEIGA